MHLPTAAPPFAPSLARAPALRFTLAAAFFRPDPSHPGPDLSQAITARPLPQESTPDFLARLALSPIPEEALTFAAHALVPRLAVWWGHEALLAWSEIVTPEDRSLLALAARWVTSQDEASRNGALLRALQAPRGPGAWIALGAGWSAPPETPPEPPPETGPDPRPIPAPHMTGEAVARGVLLALSRLPQSARRRSLAQAVIMAQSLIGEDPGHV